MPSMWICSRSRSRVVPAMSVTMAASRPARALSRLDLPALGRPAITTLAGVGATGDHHRHAVAQQRALPRRALDLGQLVANGLQLLQDVAIGQKVDLLLGEVDGRLHVDA